MDSIIKYVFITLFISGVVICFVDYVVRNNIIEPLLKKNNLMDESESNIYLQKYHIEKYREICERNGLKPRYYKFMTYYKLIIGISILSIWMLVFVIDEFIF